MLTLQGMRVLVVEDDSIISMLIEDFLDTLGCEVVATAAQLEDGLSKANNTAIDVAVLDVNLHGQLSYPIALALRGRAIPFIFATGHGMTPVPQSLTRVPILSKPFGMAELQIALHRATAVARPRSWSLPGA
jgi:DNA-binding response OmpR family regulator